MPINVKQGGVWNIGLPYVKHLGVWKEPAVYVRQSGLWKLVADLTASVTFSRPGGLTVETAEPISVLATFPASAEVTITASEPVVWEVTQTGTFATTSIPTGTTSTSITMVMASAAGLSRSNAFAVSANAGGRPRFWNVNLNTN